MKPVIKQYDNSTFWHVYDGKNRFMRIRFHYNKNCLRISRFSTTRNLKLKETVLCEKLLSLFSNKSNILKIKTIFKLLWK